MVENEVQRNLGKNYIKYLLSLFLTISSFILQGQFIEFGGGISGLSYAGDLSRGYKPLTSRIGAFGLYRMNFSDYWSVKLAVGIGSVRGDDDPAFDALGSTRNRSFKTGLIEGTANFEYYFLNFRDRNSRINWSPYAFGGFGLVRLNPDDPTEEFERIQPVIPFGIGFKYNLDVQFGLGLELGARKTFTDQIDGISNGDPFFKDFQFGNPNSSDWYYFVGISFTYTLYKIPCPFPYVPNKSLRR